MNLIQMVVMVCSIFSGGCFETQQKVFDDGERLHGHASAYVCTSVREMTRTVYIEEKELDRGVEYGVRLNPENAPVIVQLQHVASDRYVASIHRQTVILGNDRYVHVLARVRDRVVEVFSISDAAEKQLEQEIGAQSFKRMIHARDKRTFLERAALQDPHNILVTCVPTK